MTKFSLKHKLNNFDINKFDFLKKYFLYNKMDGNLMTNIKFSVLKVASL